EAERERPQPESRPPRRRGVNQLDFGRRPDQFVHRVRHDSKGRPAYNVRMISVGDAQAHILAQVATVAPPQLLPLTAPLGRVLAEDLRAPIDVPPTDNSAVDGYAVAHIEIAAGARAE